MKKTIKQHTSDEILNALHVIKDTCDYYYYTSKFGDKRETSCKKCPLCVMVEDDPVCAITDLEPDNWSIDDNPNTVWRAFK